MSLKFFAKLLVGLSLVASASVFATPLTVNVTGINSVGGFGDAGNTVLTFNVGANATITSIDYNVNITAFTPSWLSEIGLAINDSTGSDGVFFTPGFADDNPGTGSYADFADLTALGLDFQVGADGILRLEFFEAFDDFTGVDGHWNFGTITFNVEGGTTPPVSDVPEPASILLLGAGLGMMGYAGRRRGAQAGAAA
jgi:hypothetical protein